MKLTPLLREHVDDLFSTKPQTGASSRVITPIDSDLVTTFLRNKTSPTESQKKTVQALHLMELVFEDLPYMQYEGGRQRNMTTETATIYFSGSGGEELPLNKVLDNEADGLADGGQTAPLHDASSKISIRLLVSPSTVVCVR